MKKYILTTALTVASAGAFAQSYNYDSYGYDYNYNYGSSNTVAQPEYYENQPVYQAQPQTQNYQPVQNTQAGRQERSWDLAITLGVMNKAEYKGGKDDETKAMILPRAEYRLDPWQKLYLNIDHGAGYAYSLTNNFEIGGGLGYREGRDSSDAAILSGMKDVDDTATFLAYAKYKLNAYDFGIKIEKGLDSSNDGFTTELSAGYKTKLTPKLVMGTSVAAVYGDDTYMEQNFEVTAADATLTRPVSDASSGFHEASLKVYGNYHIKGPHSVMGFAKYTQLLGDAKDSSIVQDDTNISFGAGYVYKF